ncbi:MAG: hypothetical protein PHN49_02925 [Candidatus Omnitrophica bacterium]|nr:hypothetical protein [Candidatus Omnitrophota bacterium]MDD5670573.1 hypothetical protein [Candidatus Omnitrophota bacterium]
MLEQIRSFIKKVYYRIFLYPVLFIKQPFVMTKLKEDTEKSFAELAAYIRRFHPIELIAQLELTYLFAPLPHYLEQMGEMGRSLPWIELVNGIALAGNNLNKKFDQVDGAALTRIEELTELYFKNITTGILLQRPSNRKHDLLIKAKIHSLGVRGDSFPHKELELAQSLYEEHNDWFVQNLGFTIADCIDIHEALKDLMEEKSHSEKLRLQQKTKEDVAAMVSRKEIKESDRQPFEASIFCSHFFGKSHEIISFTLDDLIKTSSKPNAVCEKFLLRMSQEVGYKNNKFPHTFQYALKAPWDFNTLYEKPIVRFGDRYLIPIIATFPYAIMSTFNYDLLSDSKYEKTYSKKKGAWLEKRTANALQNLFPSNEILLNPAYPNKNEFCDVLVLRDRKVFIIQCKSKQLTYLSKIGQDLNALLSDLKEGICSSFEQAMKARDYINGNKSPIIHYGKNQMIEIDRDQITDIFLVSVTLGYYQTFATRLANIDPTLKLFQKQEYPWALSIADLEIITEIMDYPSQFVHYAKRRLELEKQKFEVVGDEIDLLDLYLDQNLCFNSETFTQCNCVGLAGYSDQIENYVTEKYQLGLSPKKPKQKMSSEFEEYLKCIESLSSSYKTDCLMHLLDLDEVGREAFVKAFKQTKDKAVKDGKIHAAFLQFKNAPFGITVLSMDAKRDINKLFRQVAVYSIANKQKEKKKEWIGFGWDTNDQRLVAIAFYSSFDWFEDSGIEEIADRILKKRK